MIIPACRSGVRRCGLPHRETGGGHGQSTRERKPSTPREPFRKSFHGGQRGIVVFRTLSEGEEVVKPSGKTETRQWMVDARDGQPRGFAFVWKRFEILDLPMPVLACVMATVPANDLIRRTIKSQEDDPRMPAILEDGAWTTWLGEDNAAPAAAKAVLKTMEGVNWQAAPEPKKPRPRKP
jgi:putative SOS response-associated peptidase YedK